MDAQGVQKAGGTHSCPRIPSPVLGSRQGALNYDLLPLFLRSDEQIGISSVGTGNDGRLRRRTVTTDLALDTRYEIWHG